MSPTFALSLIVIVVIFVAYAIYMIARGGHTTAGNSHTADKNDLEKTKILADVEKTRILSMSASEKEKLALDYKLEFFKIQAQLQIDALKTGTPQLGLPDFADELKRLSDQINAGLKHTVHFVYPKQAQTNNNHALFINGEQAKRIAQ
jgi:hypothetical protein